MKTYKHGFGGTDRTGSQLLVNEKEHCDIIYILEFKRVSDTGPEYVSETQKVTEDQYLQDFLSHKDLRIC
jgi:hypothetical protein